MLDVRSSLLATLLRRLVEAPRTTVDVTDPVGVAGIALLADDEPVTVTVTGEVTMTVREWRNLRAAAPGMTVDRSLVLTGDLVAQPR
jgi:hypothetical protein